MQDDLSKDLNKTEKHDVISVLINAISVRINMPRGTVKALLACLAVLIVAASIFAVNVLRDWSTSYYDTADYQRHVDNIIYAISSTAEEIADNDISQIVVLPAKEVVISENYSYTVPEGYINEPAWLGGEWFANARSFGVFDAAGYYCEARSYITREEIGTKDMQTIVLERLKSAEDVRNIRYETEEHDFGKVIVCRYESFEEDEPDIYAVEYSWEDDDGTICSIEVASEAGDYEAMGTQLLASVHRAKNAYTNEELVEKEKQLYDKEGIDGGDYAEWDLEDPEAFESEMLEDIEVVTEP